jgi:hypothetical protein
MRFPSTKTLFDWLSIASHYHLNLLRNLCVTVKRLHRAIKIGIIQYVFKKFEYPNQVLIA